MARGEQRRAARAGVESAAGALVVVRGGAADVEALDRVIHEKARLAIVSALAVHRSLSFTELRRLTATTDGNLSVHARRLEDAGYLVCRKGFAGRVPQTTFELTAKGRRALERYLAHMEAVIRAVREG